MKTKTTKEATSLKKILGNEEPVAGPLGKVARKLRPRKLPSADPIAELRNLAQQHVALTKVSVAQANMSKDKKNRTTGEEIACRLPADYQAKLQAVSGEFKDAAKALEKSMLRELAQVPMWNLFLKPLFGCGAVVATYIIANVDFARCQKSSSLRRYFGIALDSATGRIERPRGRMGDEKQAPKLGYNKHLKVRLYQWWMAHMKNLAKTDSSTKYFDVYLDVRHRLASIPKGAANDKARLKACDVFVEDVYIIGRALAGLPVWPSWYAAKLGYHHGGKICVNEPKLLTIDEALALVGNVGHYPSERAKAWFSRNDESTSDPSDELGDIAAE